jgi:intein/homing endonuclease
LRQYRRTAKGKEATRRSNEKCHKSEKGKAANARYAASAKGKAVRARYLASPKRKAVVARYRASPKGKEAVRRGSEKYRRSKKGKAAQKRAEEKYIESKRKNTMRRQYAKKVWKALADRYGMGTLDQIRRAIQRQLTNLGPDRPGLQAELTRDEKRCRRAIDAIGVEYPEHIKPARQPTRFGVSRKRR